MKLHHKFLNQYKRSGRPYLLYRTDKKGLHSHLAEMEHVVLLKKCLKNNTMPYHKDYEIRNDLILSAKKLLTEKEFSKLKEAKKWKDYYV